MVLCIGGGSAFLIGNIRLPTSIFTDPIRALINEFCPYFAQNPTRGQAAITKLNGILQKTNETRQLFASTIGYLSVPSKQQKLTGGNAACTQFFNELKDRLTTDWQNQNFSAGNALQKALELFQTFRDTLRSFVQSRI